MDIETFINSSALHCDYRVVNGQLAAEHDIKTAVLISLFSDRRAEEDDELPSPDASRRGWWGDALAARRIGSRLWLLSREKQLREVVNRAHGYAEEALSWLVEDGVASAVDVSAEIVTPGVLGLAVSVKRNTGSPQKFKFEFAWSNMNGVNS